MIIDEEPVDKAVIFIASNNPLNNHITKIREKPHSYS